MGLHYILQHLDKPGTYARILFVDFSSAFNTIILQNKLTQLSVPISICQRITSFLTDRQQLVRLGELTFNARTISTGAPQGFLPLSTLTTAHLKNTVAAVESFRFLGTTISQDLKWDTHINQQLSYHPAAQDWLPTEAKQG